MKTYIGTKIIKAEPQTCQVKTFKSKVGDPGYKVEYEDGYVSWSPADAFEKAYEFVEGLSFGLAIQAMKKGEKVARAGWNGKGMWICLIHPGNAMHKGYDMQDCIGLKTPANVIQPGWNASTPDVLANDWQIV